MPTNKTYSVVALHDRPELVDSCATLLNQEWKRSHGMRARSLQRSNSNFPCNLAMLEEENGVEKLVGHARLTRITGEPKSLYLSSVIIEENLRGTGLGRKLLELTEEFIKPHFDSLYLRTKSTPFYVKCGYTDCEPVQEYTSSGMEKRIQLLQDAYGGTPSNSNVPSGKPTTSVGEGNCGCSGSRPDKVLPPATATCISTSPSIEEAGCAAGIPPPPPLPPSTSSCNFDSIWDENDCDCNFWMKKVITSS